MPAYNAPLVRAQLLQKGVPAYLFGNLNMLQGNTQGYVTQTAIATNVATVSVSINQGPTPKVGDLITLWGTAQQSGLFNVTRVVITAVSITAATGAGTISFALTGTNQSAIADTGAFLTEPGETAETVTLNYASQAVLVQAPQGDSQFTLPFSVSFPTLPTAATVDLQAALKDSDTWTTIVPGIAVVAGSSQTIGPFGQVTLQRGYLYRFLVSALTGTAACVAKIGG